MYQFPPTYQRPLRYALICQVISVLLAFTILDTGLFAFQFLCFSVIFWILAGVLMLMRRHPSIVERLFIGSGPLLIFWTMFLVG
jgi:hypothetical protein